MNNLNTDSKKKILFCATVYNHLVVFHIPLIQLMIKQGYEVWAASSEMESHPKDKEKLIELNVHCIDIPFSRNPLSLNNIFAMYQMATLFSKVNFDILHFHTPVAGFIGRLMARYQKQGHIIYTAHGFHFFKGGPLKNWLLYYPLEKICAKFTDTMIVTNKEDYKQAIKLGFDQNRLHHLRGVGVDLNVYQLSKEKRVDEKKVTLAYIGELNKNKNHLFLLKNWNKIIQNNPNLHLLIIGTGPYQKKLEAYIKKYNLLNTKFLGYRKDVPCLLEEVDIVCLFSKREGLPKSILEAMGAGKPCIVSNLRGMNDLIVDKVNGFLIDLNDSKTLIESVSLLSKDTELRKKFGEASLAMIKNYSQEKIIADMKYIYMKALSNFPIDPR